MLVAPTSERLPGNFVVPTVEIDDPRQSRRGTPRIESSLPGIRSPTLRFQSEVS